MQITSIPSEPTLSHRRGKIARLPRAVREQLNVRLDDGQEAAEILPWLNDLPEVRQIISERFNGTPVSPQNLSAWRQGGFQEWLLHRELLDSAAHMREHVAELNEEIASDSPDGIPHPLADYMVATLTVRFAGFLGRWNGGPGDVQLATLLKVGQFILRLQQAAYRAEKEALGTAPSQGPGPVSGSRTPSYACRVAGVLRKNGSQRERSQKEKTPGPRKARRRPIKPSKG